MITPRDWIWLHRDYLYIIAIGIIALICATLLTSCTSTQPRLVGYATHNGAEAKLVWADVQRVESVKPQRMRYSEVMRPDGTIYTNEIPLGKLQVDSNRHLIRNSLRYLATAAVAVGADYATDGDIFGLFGSGGSGSGASSSSVPSLDPNRPTVISSATSSVEVRDAPQGSFPVSIIATDGSTVVVDFQQEAR